jgi:hypothetical protein
MMEIFSLDYIKALLHRSICKEKFSSSSHDNIGAFHKVEYCIFKLRVISLGLKCVKVNLFSSCDDYLNIASNGNNQVRDEATER